MKIRYVVGIVILAVIIGVGWLVYRTLGNLDQYLEAGIEKFGSQAIGAPLTLDGAHVDLGSGSAALRGLVVGNPAGFSTAYAVRLDEVSMALDLNAISKDTIVVREIRVQGPSVIYELASGGSNIDAIMDNVNAFTGGSKSPQQAESETAGPRLIIEDVYINGGEVSVSHQALQGRKVTTPLPDIHLEDIGKEQGGASPGEVVREIMASVKSGVTTGVASLNLNELPGALADQLKGVGEAAGSGTSAVMDRAREAGEKLKGIFK